MSLTVDFTNTSTGYIAAYLWDFGDGSFSSETNPVHTFPIAGTYHVTLYVFGVYGGRDQIEHDVTVTSICSFTFDFTLNNGGFVESGEAGYSPGVGWFLNGEHSDQINNGSGTPFKVITLSITFNITVNPLDHDQIRIFTSTVGVHQQFFMDVFASGTYTFTHAFDGSSVRAVGVSAESTGSFDEFIVTSMTVVTNGHNPFGGC